MRYISAEDVDSALDYARLIDRLREAFHTSCNAPLRHCHTITQQSGTASSVLIKPAWRDGTDGPITVKIVNVFPANLSLGLSSVQGLVVVFDGRTGVPVGVIEGQALTVRRTAAASALAADYLAPDDATTLVMVGTGLLAPALAEAHATVRAIRRTLVWGRDPAKAAALPARLGAAGQPAEPASDLAAAVAAGDVITSPTLAHYPLIHGEWLSAGTNVDLVGRYRIDMREADDVVLQRGRTFVDTRLGALAEAGDLVDPITRGIIDQSDIQAELADLSTGAAAGRVPADENTVFKSVGIALEDLAAAELALKGVGR